MDTKRPTSWLEPLPLGGGGNALPCRILPGPMEGITDGSFCRVMSARGLVRAWVTPFVRISTAVPRLARLRERLEPFGLGSENAEHRTHNGKTEERKNRPPAADPGPRTTDHGPRTTGHGHGAADHGSRATGHGPWAEGHGRHPADFPRPPVVVQLMGLDIPLLAETAKRVAELGAAGVDLNCACPSKVVLSNGAGGARLRDPAWIREALCALRKAVPELGVSVKLRSGFADSAAELPGIVAAVREARPDFVMMHFRTVQEEYREVRDGWDRLARAKELLGDGIPLLGAGDVVSAAAALNLWRQTGVDGVTPARGLLRNPWLLREIEAMCGGEVERCGCVTVKLRGGQNKKPHGSATATPPHRHAVTLSHHAEFLRELVAVSAETGEWRRGFVLELARNLFGVDAELFTGLAKAVDAGAMLKLLEQEAGGRASRPACKAGAAGFPPGS